MQIRRPVLIALAALPSLAAAAMDFNRDIRPILSDNCFTCHGQDSGSREGRLRLDERDAALRGGKSGQPAIVPGKPDESEMILRVKAAPDDEALMPPTDSHKPALTPAAVEKLRRWIADGAEYQPHWSFIAPEKRPLPPSSSGSHPIDAFVSARLAEQKLAAAPPADPAALARRIHLDVTGLPPTPAEVEAFTRSAIRNPQSAVEGLVNRLLQQDAYGEKWARLWLDAARYSDSNGYEKDLPREQWAWRDWVIGALNRDLPYDRFIVEQLAGDLLPDAGQDQIVATGFLRNSMTNEEGAIIPEQFRTEEIFDRMDCVGKAVLGLTLQCAQCHTHKFDPITHDNYYGLFAYLNNSYEAQTWVHTAEQQQTISELERTLAALDTRVKQRRPEWQDEIAAWEKNVRSQLPAWDTLIATELASVSGSTHPTQERDGSILTLGSPRSKDAAYIVAEPALAGVTGLRLEALTHRDLPFHGPGRSKFGTWALSEIAAYVQLPDSAEWRPVRLKHATADFSEPAAKLEDEWAADFDKEKRRTRGPVAFLIDGKKETAWRADRGIGQRNQDSVAVLQFESPLDYPRGTKLKVELTYEHGGGESGRENTMIGLFRLATTTAPDPRALPVDYAAILALQRPAEERTPAEQRTVFAAWRRTLDDLQGIKAEIAATWKKFPAAATSVLHLAERAPVHARPTHLLDRGAWDQPKHRVAPHTPAALHPFPDGEKPDRLGLARWLTDRRSPLTARVAVNRMWQAVFGTGLVETSEDFGTRAPVPGYLDLLDWLAVDFMEHGWSQKHLLRTILTSATYRRASRVTPDLLERDPGNRLLARGPRFRLEAEVVRDSALSLAGLLTPAIGGPSIFPPVPPSVLDYNFIKPDYWHPAQGAERYRRALYVFRKRSMPDPVLGTFDAPSGDTACVRRPRSNTPLAALAGLNETIFVEAAQGLARRILREGGASDAARADYAFRLCTARPIKPAEDKKIAALLRDTRARLAAGWISAREIATGDAAALPALPPGTTPQDAAAWTVVARVLLNLDETLTKP
jgi:hypothetical protein